MARRPILLTFSCALACAIPVAHAADGRLTLTTGIDYSTGKYGGAASTDIL